MLHVTQPQWLWLLPPAAAWTLWLAWKSHASLSRSRRILSVVLRLLLLFLLILALAGSQWMRRQDGMTAFFLLDRSESIPTAQQEESRETANRWSKNKKKEDFAGFLIFGTEAALETEATQVAAAEKIQAVVSGDRTDIASAIKLATMAFPEHGQKRLVLLSDGNENIGNAESALTAARSLGVTLDVFPLGSRTGGDAAVQRLALPTAVKKNQTFEAKIFATSDKSQPASVRLFRNDQLLGEQKVTLEPGKNLFTFPQTLANPGFYRYQIQLDVPGDRIAQNNRASSFVNVRGDPRVLVVSADPPQDRSLAQALRDAKVEVTLTDITGFPSNLAEITSYDALVLSNVSASDLGRDFMSLLESAVRDFGTGLVCVGGDNAFAAGGYRHTPLEEMLPVDMELSSKKVLPKGALVMVMHGMEFMNGNQIARDIALGALDALGPQDELGVNLWDGTTKWVVELQPVGNRSTMAKAIAGMNQGDMPSFDGPVRMAYDALKQSRANVKHMIIFSDGDPGPPNPSVMRDIANSRITVSTVMIGGHVEPQIMVQMAEQGSGRFYDVKSPAQLPQIFLKETTIILKSAISEEPFKPQMASGSELIRGINAGSFPILQGYVATTHKPRAETPLVTDKGDPLLAHWQFGLGRTVAFTSDAKAKWAQDWLGWSQYRQFWSQTAGWALRRIDTTDLNADITIDNGSGHISVEALDVQGNFRNFLRLRATVVSPRGQRENVALEQKGPGHYEAEFASKDVGAYLVNLQEIDNEGNVRGSQIVGANVNYSPEFNTSEPNLHLLERLAELGGGKLLEETDNPFLLNRQKTYQPRDLWNLLLEAMLLLFLVDVGIRRLDFDRDEWAKWWAKFRVKFGFSDTAKATATQESLGALFAARERARAGGTYESPATRPRETSPKQSSPELFKPQSSPTQPPTQFPESPPTSQPEPREPAEAPPENPSDAAANTTSRLLDAKRRAKRRK